MCTYYRWVPKEYVTVALQKGLVSHNTSAMWIFDLGQDYRPSGKIAKGSILIAYDMTKNAHTNMTTVNLIDFESHDFRGEAAHPDKNIFKENERGAYGIGKSRQPTTNFHTKTRLATKKEVAKALGLNEMEVDAYKPAAGWPK